jgi:alkaline phosphatase D
MLTRRHLLKSIVLSAGSLGAASLLSACRSGESGSPGPSRPAAEVFPQSVASGDPRPDSLVLWTRAIDPDRPGISMRPRLDVATDEGFNQLIISETVLADSDHDGCVKVRITGLSPRTTYYYRFVLGTAVSNTGRSKTAPSPDSDVEVRYAWASCHDFIDRYYNAYLTILEEDLDFVCFIGDYIYETTGDPQYQTSTGPRAVTFSNPDEALRLRNANSPEYLAANSVGNYRDLYKLYRSDALLQRMHERFAFICTWDDHEFSDDAWGAVATYYDGAEPEAMSQRKRHAEQAFFEFMPIDQASVAGDVSDVHGAVALDDSQLYPATRIYRDFRFGKNLQLWLTDYRSFRPDHPIPEDGFPGKVIIDQAALTTFLAGRGVSFAAVSDQYTHYTDIEAPANADRRQAMRTRLTTLYREELTARGLDPDARSAAVTAWVETATTGNIAADSVNEYAVGVTPFSADEIAAMPRGLAYLSLFKTTLFSDIGARYFTIKPVYDVFAAWVNQQAGSIPSVWGATQAQWLDRTLRASDAPWKVVASAVSLSPMLFDLGQPPLPFISGLYNFVPASLKEEFYMFLDQWDGLPEQKQALLSGVLGEVGAITISGDVHATFVSEHPVTSTGKRIIDFTGPAVSSGTLSDFGYIAADTINPLMRAVVPQLANALIQATDTDYRPAATSRIRYCAPDSHGTAIMTVNADKVTVEFRLTPSSVRNGSGNVVSTYYGESYYDNVANYLALQSVVRFEVDAQGQLTQLDA